MIKTIKEGVYIFQMVYIQKHITDYKFLSQPTILHFQEGKSTK